MALVGIDFGTAHTRAVLGPVGASATPREVVVPSLVLVRPDGWLIGDRALGAAQAEASRVLRGFKRWLGRAPGDPVAEVVAEACSATLSMSADALVVHTHDGLNVDVVEAVARLLGRAAELATGGDEAVLAVIATPGWYDEAQELSLRAAAGRAGIEVLRFIEEAAAMALALRFEDPGERTVAIVSAGAGSLNVSFASIESDSVFLLASGSDRRIGGDDVTRSLVDSLLARDVRDDPSAVERCRQGVESMKQQLTVGDASHHLIELADGRRLELSLEAEQLEQALGVLRAPLRALWGEALEAAALEPSEVDVVYACGGMSTLAAVSELVFDVTSHVPRCGPSLQSLVARGAVIQASILDGQIEGPLVFDGKSTHSSRAPESGQLGR